MRIQPANTHSVWDPGWAVPQITHRYRPQLELGEELTRYGADLLLRSLQSAPDDVPNHVVLSVLFRQAVAALDGTQVALRAGAVGAAIIHARGQMEAGWGLALALRNPHKWGRHIYVTSMRQQRLWTARLLPGTNEFDAYESGRSLLGAAALTEPSALDELRTHLDATDAVLAKPEYAAIDAGYSRELARTGRTREWYFDPDAAPAAQITSIYKLAEAVGATGEYQTIYKHSSNYVHGTFTGTHLRVDENGVAVAGIRTPEEWRQTYVLSVSLAAAAYRRIIDTYRSGELDQYVRTYVERWKGTIAATPEVVLVLERLANR